MMGKNSLKGKYVIEEVLYKIYHSPSLPPLNFTRTDLSMYFDKSKIDSFFFFS